MPTPEEWKGMVENWTENYKAMAKYFMGLPEGSYQEIAATRKHLISKRNVRRFQTWLTRPDTMLWFALVIGGGCLFMLIQISAINREAEKVSWLFNLSVKDFTPEQHWLSARAWLLGAGLTLLGLLTARFLLFVFRALWSMIPED